MAISEQKISTYKNQFLFDKNNFKFVLIGLGLMILGFLLMIGGKTTDPNVYNADELYSFRRITLAPILIIIGLIVQIYAILLKPKVIETADLTENNNNITASNTIFQTGEKCVIAGTYVCQKHLDVKVTLSKGEKFPTCKKMNGKATQWQLKNS